jgi:hypothetical protein
VRRLALCGQPVELQGCHLQLGGLRRSAFVVDEDVARTWLRGLDSLDQAEARGLADGFDAVAGVELVHGVTDVLLDRVPAEVETLADLGIRQAFGHERQDSLLLPGQLRLKILRHLASMVVRGARITTHAGGSEPDTWGLLPHQHLGHRRGMRKRALASAACILVVAACAAFAPGVSRADDTVVQQTSDSSASSSATNDNSVSQSATATQTGSSGGQSQTIEQNASTEQSANPSATSTQAPVNASSGGSSSQHSGSDSSASAGNTNATTQATTQDQSAQPASSGQSQNTAQSAPVNQNADARASSSQISPTNVNVVVRIDSPGNDGPVTQTNSSAANAAAGNTNAVAQDAGQSQAAPAGSTGGQAQSAVQSAPVTQDSQAGAASTQVAPLNANIVVRNKSPGDSAGVTQTNSSQATAQAANQNAVNQSADQSQTQSGADVNGGQSQSLVQSAPTIQSATSDAVSTQTSPTNAGIWVNVDGSALAPDGSGGHGVLITIWIPNGDPVREPPIAQTNASTATATATNTNTVSQTASQVQSGGSGGGSQSGGEGQSQTLVQEAPTSQTQTSTATSDGNSIEEQLGIATVLIAAIEPAIETGGWILAPPPVSAASTKRWSAGADPRATSSEPRSRRPDSRAPDHRRAPLPSSPDRDKASLGAGVDRGGSDGGVALVVLAFLLSAPWWARRQVPSVLRRLMAVVSRLERPG